MWQMIKGGCYVCVREWRKKWRKIFSAFLQFNVDVWSMSVKMVIFDQFSFDIATFRGNASVIFVYIRSVLSTASAESNYIRLRTKSIRSYGRMCWVWLIFGGIGTVGINVSVDSNSIGSSIRACVVLLALFCFGLAVQLKYIRTEIAQIVKKLRN